MIKIKYIVHGRVQGVGYRYFVKQTAIRLGVYGHVKNLLDGTVEVVCVAQKSKTRLLKKELEKGSLYSEINYIDEERLNESTSDMSFEIQ